MEAGKFIRSYVQELAPYSTARDEFTGSAEVFLDANENPWESGVNRYPDPHQRAIKERVAAMRGISPEQIFVGNGSDEAIELLVRAVDCAVGGITITPPTYGMYRVVARAHNVSVVEAPLRSDFSLDLGRIAQASRDGSQLLFLCSPNNPTGAEYNVDDIRAVCECFRGIVVVDEAYIDFSSKQSAATLLSECDRLVVLQTFSKAWGLAGIRAGVALGSSAIIAALAKLKLPYNVSALTQRYLLKRLNDPEQVTREVQEIVQERSRVAAALNEVLCVKRVFPSGGNFLLVQVADVGRVFTTLQEAGVIVRDRSSEVGCSGCIRITVGTPMENDRMLTVLRSIV